jgi:DNA repair exonuclease SbcCD nuclease subunit
MKILAVSDQVIDRLYSTTVKEAYPDISMIIGCGDLPYPYLEFLATIFNVPMYYVPGNHDPAYKMDETSSAQGGFNLDGQVTHTKRLLMAGLGGSVYYAPGGPNQYSQQEMYLRVYRLLPKIMLAQRKHKRSLDILVTHSPPDGIHDDDDPTHRGLRALNFLLDRVQPRFMLHGHTMFYRQNLQSHITRYKRTDIVNVYPFRVFEIE